MQPAIFIRIRGEDNRILGEFRQYGSTRMQVERNAEAMRRIFTEASAIEIVIKQA